MSTTRIPPALRIAVIERAGGHCEYCRLPEEATWVPHEIDHVIAEKHRGQTTVDNLALACAPCNSHKGSDLASVDPQTGKITQLFNPRIQHWHEHFRLAEDGTIVPSTAEGRVTVLLLRCNDPLRQQQRANLIAARQLTPDPG
ncbi:MAG: HNH endonuclease [Deltaproteobacteria bacterium]|nr:HNH endonuclease [Deltaproteobacteria bacterium]